MKIKNIYVYMELQEIIYDLYLSTHVAMNDQPSLPKRKVLAISKG